MTTIISVTGAVYINNEQTAINCTVTTQQLGVLPYTCRSDDVAPFGQELWQALIAGEYGPISPYVPPV